MTKFKCERKNKKNSGRSSKMTPSCKWPILREFYPQNYRDLAIAKSCLVSAVSLYSCRKLNSRQMDARFLKRPKPTSFPIRGSKCSDPTVSLDKESQQ